MQDDRPNVNTIAPITNVALMMALVERVTDRVRGLPGMATFYGPSGYGKSMATAFAANEHRGFYVQMKSTYTTKHLMRMIAIEIGVDPTGTIATLTDRIGEQLAFSQRPLFIDEADFLVGKKMIEAVRDLYESSDAAIILIGEEQFPRKLEKWERVHGRMMDWVAAQPVNTRDAKHLAAIYCPGIDVEDALFNRMMKSSGASARRISVNLNAIREFAAVRQLSTVTAKDWGDLAFSTGRAPEARRVF